MKHFKVIPALLILLLTIGFSLQSGAQMPLLLKSGTRTPALNTEAYIAGFSLQNEKSFNGRFFKIIQFSALPSENDKEDLLKAGVDLLSYLPDNAYFASITHQVNLQLLPEKGIISISDITVNDRLAPSLLTREIPVYALRGSGRAEVVVTLFPGVSAADAIAALSIPGYKVIRTSGNGTILHLEVPVTEIPLLADFPFIQFIEPCDPPAEHDNYKGRTLHRATASFNPSAGLNDYDGTNVRVMLNDDGVIGPHIDFTGRIPYQFTTTTGADHGDHCAGIILGSGNLNPLGMGMAPAADLVVYNATNYPGFDSIYNQYQTLGIRLTSTSYSDGCNAGYTNRAATLDNQLRTMPELMHVFSAGNNGTQNCSYGAGSNWGNITGGHKMSKNAIAVANLDYKDELASSSSRGPAHDGRIKPEVSAQGTNVFSTSENNTYVLKSGTSMSCPGVTGTLATLYDAYQRHQGSTPHGALMKGILMNSADDLGNPGPDFKFGYGRINARRAAEIIEDTLFKTDFISNGDSVIYNLQVPAGTKEIRIMLTWSDYEAAINATRTLVNNLDLVVAGPDTTLLPWVLNHLPNATTLNAPAIRSTDTINNQEQVTMANPTPGNYQIKLYGTSVPMGPQRFFINWLMTGNEFILTWPQGGTQFVPGDTSYIRWDASPSTQGFSLHYTVNNGATWDSISTVVPAESRYWPWIIPSLATGNVQVRLVRGADTFVSEPFSIIGVPQNIIFNWVCSDSMNLSWNQVTGATSYTIFRLGSKYMDSLTTVTTTSATLTGIPSGSTEWFAVNARGVQNANGRRSIARVRDPGLVNCTYSFDVTMKQITGPLPSILTTCHTIQPLVVSCNIQNTGAVAVSNIPVKYRLNQLGLVGETYTGTINPGSTVSFTFSTPVTVTAAGDYLLTVWSQLSSDQYKSNDTLKVSFKVASFPVLQVPFLEDFENFTLCTTSNNCEQNVCTLSSGWYNPDNNLFDNTDWLAYSGTTPSGNTGPAGDHTLGTTTGKYIYVESSYCFQKTSTVMTPCIDLSGNTLPVLSFWYHMYGTGMGSLRLDVLSDGVWIGDFITPIQGNQGNAWKNLLVPLDTFAGKSINLRFRAITGADYLSDICLDDIGVVETSGIDDAIAEDLYSLYPNPAKDLVRITGLTPSDGVVAFELLNLSQQLLFSQSGTVRKGVFHFDVPLADIAPGIYLCKINLPGFIITKKLVVTK
jgi:subtilisin family serine protease